MNLTLQNTWLADLVNLVYPDVCTACGKRLNAQENLLCLQCEHDLPQTNYHLETDNPLAKKFWGRVNLENVAALYFFNKGSRTQRLIHQLKYKNNTKIGARLGRIYGEILKNVPAFQSIDVILPIPLHPEKQKRRGYNQSDPICEGLSEGMGIPWHSDWVIRKVFTESQTRKARFQRWENVESIFGLSQPNLLRHKHILLVDDVITTGSTMEACANRLLQVHDTKVSAVSLACASHF